MLDDTSTAYTAALTRGDHDEAERLGRVLDIATQLEQRQRDTVDLHAAALDYAQQGIAGFPLRPRDKRPLTGHGFKDATTDPGQITAWWTATPDANIGVPTGHTFDVVDIDGTEGLAALYNGDPAAVDSLTILGVAMTSRDGGRHLYVPSTGRGNGTQWWPGVDYRGLGGYVVAPPSIGANGRRYTWTQPLNVAQAAAA